MGRDMTCARAGLVGVGVIGARWIATVGVAATLSQAAWAGTDSMRCDAPLQWHDVSAISITMRSTPRDNGWAVTMTLSTTLYDNGAWVVGTVDPPPADGQARSDVIQLDRPQGAVTVASKAMGPIDLGEAAMVFEMPFKLMALQFHGPCDLRDGIRYPIDFHAGDDSLSGEFELKGSSIRFEFQDERSSDVVAYSGSIGYVRPLGLLPADVPIHGWKLFHGSFRPEDGTPSAFKTLGELLKSLETAPAK